MNNVRAYINPTHKTKEKIKEEKFGVLAFKVNPTHMVGCPLMKF